MASRVGHCGVIYLVEGSRGSHEDYERWPVAAYLDDKRAAEEHAKLAKLESDALDAIMRPRMDRYFSNEKATRCPRRPLLGTDKHQHENAGVVDATYSVVAVPLLQEVPGTVHVSYVLPPRKLR